MTTISFSRFPLSVSVSSVYSCPKCGETNHLAKHCQWRGRAELGEARGSGKSSQTTRVGALVPPGEQVKKQPKSRKTEIDEALAGVMTTMHTVTPSKDDVCLGLGLGPTLTTEVELEGSPVKVLVDTGSPCTIVSLDYLPSKCWRNRR